MELPGSGVLDKGYIVILLVAPAEQGHFCLVYQACNLNLHQESHQYMRCVRGLRRSIRRSFLVLASTR